MLRPAGYPRGYAKRIMTNNNTAIIYGIFLSFIILICQSLARSMVDVESYERKKLRSFYKNGLVRHCALSGLELGIYAILLYGAVLYAEHKIIWKTLFIVLSISGLLFLICSMYFSLNKGKAPKINPPIEITPKFIDKKIKKRKIVWFVQIFVLLFWVFSWYPIFS
jgi:hypothetical protein